MINIKFQGDWNFDGDKAIRETFINGIIERVPAARPYKHLIKIQKTGSAWKADISALPTSVVQKINEVLG